VLLLPCIHESYSYTASTAPSIYHSIAHANNRWNYNNNYFSKSNYVKVIYDFKLSESTQKKEEASITVNGDASSSIHLSSSSIIQEESLESTTESTVIGSLKPTLIDDLITKMGKDLNELRMNGKVFINVEKVDLYFQPPLYAVEESQKSFRLSISQE